MHLQNILSTNAAVGIDFHVELERAISAVDGLRVSAWTKGVAVSNLSTQRTACQNRRRVKTRLNPEPVVGAPITDVGAVSGGRTGRPAFCNLAGLGSLGCILSFRIVPGDAARRRRWVEGHPGRNAKSSHACNAAGFSSPTTTCSAHRSLWL
jgi:hypothetical protein